MCCIVFNASVELGAIEDRLCHMQALAFDSAYDKDDEMLVTKNAKIQEQLPILDCVTAL